MPSLDDCKTAKRKVAGRFLAKYFRERSSGKLTKLLRGRSLLMSDAVAAAHVQVHAVGVGRKIVNGKETRHWCIRLYVLQKLPPSVLGTAALPSELAGIPTDIIEAPPAYLMPAPEPPSCSINREKPIRPAVPGISVGHFGVTAGTLGCFCRLRNDDNNPPGVYLLSNCHVLAPRGLAVSNDAITQPGRADGGDTEHRVGGLADPVIPIKIGPRERNDIDAAIAKVDDGIEWDPAICAIGRIQGTMNGSPKQLVRMHGKKTAMSFGVIDDIEYDPVVGLNPQNRELVARFENQLKISPVLPSQFFGKGGDSGSLVLDQTSRTAVGLFFGGPEDGSYGLASPIERVMDMLKIDLV